VKIEKDKEAQINVRKFHIVERNGEPYIRREPYVYDIPEGKGLQILGHAYFANLASTAYDLKVGKLKEGDLPPAAVAVRNLMKPLPIMSISSQRFRSSDMGISKRPGRIMDWHGCNGY